MSDSSEDAYYDPALFGIMGALALMFIIMCVVLQLFARYVLNNSFTLTFVLLTTLLIQT